MSSLHSEVDPDGLLEYSVVFTDRALNHMSQRFQAVMRDIGAVLRDAYRAHAVIFVPGSGTFGMEAVARQFATGRKALVIRNGWFSYRWTQIFDMGRIPSAHSVLKARAANPGAQSPFVPPPIEEVVAAVRAERPDVVFAPHVETASGMILPDDYLRAVTKAVHEVNGLFVLDCIASGAMWIDMQDIGVDVLISAPQKGWSGSPCGAFVMLTERARRAMGGTSSTSFAADLGKWLQIMEAYEGGGHAYHATLPTDALARTRDAMVETRACGFEPLRLGQLDLGRKVRALLIARGLHSVAAEPFQAPSVIVSYTPQEEGVYRAFLGAGLQIAAGVPLQCDEPANFKTFRIGLFGLDKLLNVDRTVAYLETAFEQVFGAAR